MAFGGNDEQALRILVNVRAGIGGAPCGRLLLIETVIVSGIDRYVPERIGLEMLAIHGGHDRTHAQLSDLLRQAGFAVTRIVPLSMSSLPCSLA